MMEFGFTTLAISHVTWSTIGDVTNATCYHVERDVIHDVTAAAVAVDNKCDVNAYEYADLTQVVAVRVIFVALYVVVAVVTVVGNAMVVWTVVGQRHMRSTATNCYILNLAVADLLVAVLVMPMKLAEYTAPCGQLVMLLGLPVVCPLVYYVLPVIVFASVLTLVAISVERYNREHFSISANSRHVAWGPKAVLCPFPKKTIL